MGNKGSTPKPSSASIYFHDEGGSQISIRPIHRDNNGNDVKAYHDWGSWVMLHNRQIAALQAEIDLLKQKQNAATAVCQLCSNEK